MNIENSLYEKVEKEYANLIEELKGQSKEEIIKRAYEITVKEEIKEHLPYMDLDEVEIGALLSQDNTLAEFYHDWLDDDLGIHEVLEPSMEESIAIATRYYKRNDNER